MKEFFNVKNVVIVCIALNVVHVLMVLLEPHKVKKVS